MFLDLPEVAKGYVTYVLCAHSHKAKLITGHLVCICVSNVEEEEGNVVSVCKQCVRGGGWGCLESQTRLVQTKEVYVILVIPQELGWGRLEEKFSSASPRIEK